MRKSQAKINEEKMQAEFWSKMTPEQRKFYYTLAERKIHKAEREAKKQARIFREIINDFSEELKNLRSLN